MGWPLEAFLALAAFLGHFSLAVWLFNRLHAVPLQRRAIKILEKALLLAAAAVVIAFAWQWLANGRAFASPAESLITMGDRAWLAYASLCWLVAVLAVPLWLVPKLWERTPAALAMNDTRVVDVVERLGYAPVHGREFQLWSRFPGNEMLQVAVQEKTLRLPQLPPALEGLRIAHLSDLHITGHVGREFYDVIVEETNALVPDLVVITGDILEKAACLPWIEPTLGRLQARLGKYFILGNHELRLGDVAPLRAAVAGCGFVDLGSRCETLTIDGAKLLLAGNELPWFGAAPQCRTQNAEFRILLSHSPDQLPWARANRFDLMLAGHNHGGQIRLPYLGADRAELVWMPIRRRLISRATDAVACQPRPGGRASDSAQLPARAALLVLTGSGPRGA